MDNQKWWKNIDKKAEEISPKKIKKVAVYLIILAIAALAVVTSVYTVNDKQQAVVTTFGKVTSVTDPGLHFKLPFGIQKATLVEVNVHRKIEIGYRSSENQDGTAVDTTLVDAESKMISGDYNIVNCD